MKNVIISHLHYDHCGNYDTFPNARFHVQDTEMAYATGRCMCHQHLRIPFEEEDVVAMVRKVFAGRVTFHDGASQIAPGITVHKIGGHSKGLQCVRVKTKRGDVVLASDTAHLYSHLNEGRVFPITYNVGEVLDGYDTMKRLAASPNHIVPGHDPLVLKYYPAAKRRPRRLGRAARRRSQGVEPADGAVPASLQKPRPMRVRRGSVKQRKPFRARAAICSDDSVDSRGGSIRHAE